MRGDTAAVAATAFALLLLTVATFASLAVDMAR